LFCQNFPHEFSPSGGYFPSNYRSSQGLFVSRNIVEAHGGKIQAQNNADGKGAVFSFTIPKVANS
jgi:K+-sensing histidine kinase KdpD